MASWQGDIACSLRDARDAVASTSLPDRTIGAARGRPSTNIRFRNATLDSHLFLCFDSSAWRGCRRRRVTELPRSSARWTTPSRPASDRSSDLHFIRRTRLRMDIARQVKTRCSPSVTRSARRSSRDGSAREVPQQTRVRSLAHRSSGAWRELGRPHHIRSARGRGRRSRSLIPRAESAGRANRCYWRFSRGRFTCPLEAKPGAKCGGS